jgi:hypothetical protein
MINSVKNDVVTAIKGTGDVAQAAADTVTKTLGTTIKDVGKTGASVTDATATERLANPWTGADNQRAAQTSAFSGKNLELNK